MRALTALLALGTAEATPDCPRGPTHPCREPAAPVLASGFAASNLFWPGETDARNVTYACTYRPMVTLVNATRLLAIGACVPAECEERTGFCNGLHLLGASAKGDCWAGCMKHSDDGGRSWSRIERVMPSDDDFWVGMLLRERRSGDILLQRVMPTFKKNPGAVVQVRSTSGGATWSAPTDISAMLGPLFSPGRGKGLIDDQMLNVGPSTQALQLSATNPHHPHRILFAGHHGAYEYDVIWFSDDFGASYTLAKNASDPSKPAQLWGQDEIALAETPDGGVIASTRNELFHAGYAGHESTCNCRGLARSDDGGSTIGGSAPDPVLVGPVCQATMLTVPSRGPGGGLTIFHANPSHGTPKETKSPPDGRASGIIRRSENGGRTWEASVVLNGHEAYAYSCLTEVPQPGFIGLAFETVLPGSDIRKTASANNVVFVVIPQNFSDDQSTLKTDDTAGEIDLDGSWHFATADGAFVGNVTTPGVWQSQGIGAETALLRHQYVGVASYSKAVDLSQRPANSTCWLWIGGAPGGVVRSAIVSANGLRVGRHVGYLSPVEMRLPCADNLELTVAVDSRWKMAEDPLYGSGSWDMSFGGFGGIVGHAKILFRRPAWIEDSLRVRSEPVAGSADGSWRSAFRASVLGSVDAGTVLSVLVCEDVPGTACAGGGTASTPVPRARGSVSLAVTIPQAKLWIPGTRAARANLYWAHCTLASADGSTLSTRSIRFGVKKIELVGSRIMFNGERLYLRGYGDDAAFATTAAPPTNKAFYYRQLSDMRSLGYNFIRLHTHSMPSEFFDAADELGFLCDPEFAITHESPSLKLGWLGNSAVREVFNASFTSVVQRHAHRPSIFAWVLSNEMYFSNETAKCKMVTLFSICLLPVSLTPNASLSQTGTTVETIASSSCSCTAGPSRSIRSAPATTPTESQRLGSAPRCRRFSGRSSLWKRLRAGTARTRAPPAASPTCSLRRRVGVTPSTPHPGSTRSGNRRDLPAAADRRSFGTALTMGRICLQTCQCLRLCTKPTTAELSPGWRRTVIRSQAPSSRAASCTATRASDASTSSTCCTRTTCGRRPRRNFTRSGPRSTLRVIT